jgi:hypothetical protein
MTEPEAALVECYSGHTYAQEPRALAWQGRRYQVAEVKDRWRTPEGPSFRVLAESGELFELHYHELTETWAIRALPDAHRVVGAGGADAERVHQSGVEILHKSATGGPERA